jgi:hypothetical protein
MRIVGIADSDSYVKWGASLLSSIPDGSEVSLIIVRSPKQPSADQLQSALSGTAISADAVRVLDFDAAVSAVRVGQPDAVLVSSIGPLADVLIEALVTLPANSAIRRPIVVSGLPGIGLPARRKALMYRSQADLVVLHSKREVRRFVRIAEHNRLEQRFGLATFPFLDDRSRGGRPDGDVVFAAQAIVPVSTRERILLLSWLVQFARRHGERRVVIKVRARSGEAQTHAEEHGFEDLLAAKFAGAPANLVVEDGPMADHLDRASALVTVSSTAALEAIARDIPVLIIDEFGISPALINEVFIGSGLLGSADDLLEGRFFEARESWKQDNYFHDTAENDWFGQLATLVEQHAADPLAARQRVVRGRGGRLRRAWDRRQALGVNDTSPLGLAALIVGTPARRLVIIAQRSARLSRRRSRARRRLLAARRDASREVVVHHIA